jgi:hypothetical protein
MLHGTAWIRVLTSLTLGLGGCKPAAVTEASKAKLEDGVVDIADVFPAVLGIGSGEIETLPGQPEIAIPFCTVTAVSATVVVSAAHCFAEDPPGTSYWLADALGRRLRDADGQVLSGVAMLNPAYDLKRLVETMRMDLAFVRFERAQFVQPYVFTSEMPRVGASVMLVGYGYDTKNQHAGRQFGPNVINAIVDAQTRTIDGKPFLPTEHSMIRVLLDREENKKRAEKHAITVKGDSGGPLIENSAIIGILRGSDGSDEVDPRFSGSLYVNPLFEENRRFIDSVRAKGWDVPVILPRP